MALFIKKRDFKISNNGIDKVEKINLGGVDQTVLIQAVDPTKPVLLLVHGGPCTPAPGVVSRGQDYAVAISTKELVKNFVVVFYDQRGAGKSYDKNTPRSSYRTEQYYEDCNELIDILRIRYGQEKIYLAGHSWGSIIGMTMALRCPEKLHAYFGISQIIDWSENDKLVYEWLKGEAEKAGDKKLLQKMAEWGKPPYLELNKWIEFRRPMIKYKSMVYTSETVKNPGMAGMFKMFLYSSEYSLSDIFHTLYSSFNHTYTQELIEDFAKIRFNPKDKLEIPVVFLHGSHDVHVSGKPVENYYKELDAPHGKELVWCENSAHMFHPDDAKAIEKYIIEYKESRHETNAKV